MRPASRDWERSEAGNVDCARARQINGCKKRISRGEAHETARLRHGDKRRGLTPTGNQEHKVRGRQEKAKDDRVECDKQFQ